MAHPKRKKFVEYLLEQLGDVPIIWDKYNDVWETRTRAMKQHVEAGKRWSLTIQDDCLLTTDFLRKVRQFMLRYDRPNRRVHSFNFYLWANDNSLVRRAFKNGYYRNLGMKSGLAICLRTDLIPAILERWQGDPELYKHDDSRIGRFLRERHLKTYYPCPSLVQHRDAPSLIYTPAEVPFERKAIFYEA